MPQFRITAPILRVAGLVLLVASFAKAYALATGPVTATNVWTSRAFGIALTEFEFLLGGWLITGAYATHASVVAIGTFAVFSVVSLANAILGRPCDCFGRLGIHAWFAFSIDFSLCIGLLLALKAARVNVAPKYSNRQVLTIGAIMIGVGILGFIPMARYAPATLSDTGDIIGDVSSVDLWPESWLGRPFPLLRHIREGDELRQGSWLVMLHRNKCRECQEAFPFFCQLALDSSGNEKNPRVAFIEIPPYGDDLFSGSPSAVWLATRLDETRDWNVPTPH
jgi:hypothetical protein